MTTATTQPHSQTTGAPRSAAMRAIVQRRYGSADVLGVGEVALPAIGAGDVLVEVRAAGLDRGTWHLMAGLPLAVRLAGVGLRAPRSPVPGVDLAGVVVAVGAFVVSVPQYIPRSAFPADFPLALPDREVFGNGGAAIVEPAWGTVVAGPLYGEEGMLVCDCDLRLGLHAKRVFDAVGHYSRDDVLAGPATAVARVGEPEGAPQ